MTSLNQYIDLYREHGQSVLDNAPEALNKPRPRAFERLMGASLPKKGDEGYPAISVADLLAPDYGVNIARVAIPATFSCAVPNISTLMALVVNDAFSPTESMIRNLPQGVTVMSLAQAARKMPEAIEKYYDTLAGNAVVNPSGTTEFYDKAHAGKMSETDGVAALNSLFAQDGVYVHVDKGVHLEKPLQIVNLFNASMPLMSMRRVLIVLEEGASVSLLSCDHTSVQGTKYMNCQVSEVFMAKDSKLELVDMEESTPDTSRLSKFYASLGEGASLTLNNTTLTCGQTRNECCIRMEGRGASVKLAGMAIASDDQVVENYTRVYHNAPDCYSDQMYKYILDDSAKGAFYGTIVVDECAKHTKAYQSNRNVLASKKARMFTRPQLEIYCDDVKCSHGATVGQLDQRALFYMQSRGIPEAEAKKMLLQAFTTDVIDTVTIPALQARLQHLVEMSLGGTRDFCNTCRS